MKARALHIASPTLALFLLAAGTVAHAGVKDDAVAASASYSSSASTSDTLPDEPQGQSGVPPAPKPVKAQKQTPALAASVPVDITQPAKPARKTIRPFSTVGIAVKAGIAGAGFDVAVPLARKFNLRGGASFFSFDHTFTSDGTIYNASLDLKTAMVAIDWFPFGGAFRVSPIVQVYNGNTVTALTTEPAASSGQNFDLGDTNYFSSSTDPVHGTAAVSFGNQSGSKVAPGFTIGWGNMIPRGKGEHWSVPFEIGFLYIDTPQIALTFQGTGCTSQADAVAGTGPSCVNIGTNPTAQANVQQQQTDINNDLSALRFYPVVSIGLSYKF